MHMRSLFIATPIITFRSRPVICLLPVFRSLADLLKDIQYFFLFISFYILFFKLACLLFTIMAGGIYQFHFASVFVNRDFDDHPFQKLVIDFK